MVGNFATALPFSPAIEVDFADQAMALSTVSLVSVFNANGDNITSNWALDEFNEAGQDDKYNLRIVTPIYYSPEASKNTFIFTFIFRNDDPSTYLSKYELYNYKSKFKTGIWNAYNENGDFLPVIRTLTDPVTTFAGSNLEGILKDNKE